MRVADECLRQVPPPWPSLSHSACCADRNTNVVVRCMQTNNDNFQACSFYFDMMKQCKASAQQ